MLTAVLFAIVIILRNSVQDNEHEGIGSLSSKLISKGSFYITITQKTGMRIINLAEIQVLSEGEPLRRSELQLYLSGTSATLCNDGDLETSCISKKRDKMPELVVVSGREFDEVVVTNTKDRLDLIVGAVISGTLDGGKSWQFHSTFKEAKEQYVFHTTFLEVIPPNTRWSFSCENGLIKTMDAVYGTCSGDCGRKKRACSQNVYSFVSATCDGTQTCARGSTPTNIFPFDSCPEDSELSIEYNCILQADGEKGAVSSKKKLEYYGTKDEEGMFGSVQHAAILSHKAHKTKVLNFAEVQVFYKGKQVPSSELKFTLSNKDASECNDGDMKTFCHSDRSDPKPQLTIVSQSSFDNVIVVNRLEACQYRAIGVVISTTHDGGKTWTLSSTLKDIQDVYVYEPLPCEDSPIGWFDSEELTCQDYKSMRLCTPDGDYGEHWQHSLLRTFRHHANKDRISATHACCHCGGGVQKVRMEPERKIDLS